LLLSGLIGRRRQLKLEKSTKLGVWIAAQRSPQQMPTRHAGLPFSTQRSDHFLCEVAWRLSMWDAGNHLEQTP
jgi:hypothetical protein